MNPVFTRTVQVTLLSAAALTGIGTPAALAAGFYIQEQSVRGLGSAFSGSVTTLDDPSTLFFNPAGMTQLDGTRLQAGVNLLVPNAKVRDTGSVAPVVGVPSPVGGPSGNPYDPTPVPNAYITHQINDRVWAGLGVSAPFGLASDYGDTWFGRFDSTKTELSVIDIQPTLAFKISERLSIGGGINIQRADADLRNRVMIGAATEANSKLTGDDWSFGYSFGAQFRATDATTIGLNYKSSVHHNLDGKIDVTTLAGAPVGALTSGGSAKLVTPDHATLGIAQKINDRLTVQGQATWFGWNNFGAITAYRDSGAVASSVEQNYQTTWTFAIGAEYAASDRWILRGGLQFDETPTTDEFRTSRTPDGDRTWVSLGATYAVSPKIDLDMAGTYIDVEDGTINLIRGGGAPLPGTPGQMRATTEGNVGILALGVTYKF